MASSQIFQEQRKPLVNITPSPLPTVSWRYLFARTVPALVGTLACHCLVLILLKVYQDQGILTKWDRRGLNTSILLLSALLSIGIGIILDQLALILRGRMVQVWQHRKSHQTDKRHLEYILCGTIGSYAKFLWSKCSNRHFDSSALVVFFFLLGNIVGRLSVATFGLTFGMAQYQNTTTSTVVAQWPNATMRDSYGMNDTDVVGSSISASQLLQLVRNTMQERQLPYMLLDGFLQDNGLNLTYQDIRDKREAISKFFVYDNRKIAIGVIQVVATCQQGRNTKSMVNQTLPREICVYSTGSDEVALFIPNHGPDCGPGCSRIEVVRNAIISRQNSSDEYKFDGISAIPWFKRQFRVPEDRWTDNCTISVHFNPASNASLPANGTPGPAILRLLSGFLATNTMQRPQNINLYDSADWYWLLNNSVQYKMGDLLARIVGLAAWALEEKSPRLVIGETRSWWQSRLVVDWPRVIAVVSGITFIQVLMLGLVGLYSLGWLLIDDDVAQLQQVLAQVKTKLN